MRNKKLKKVSQVQGRETLERAYKQSQDLFVGSLAVFFAALTTDAVYAIVSYRSYGHLHYPLILVLGFLASGMLFGIAVWNKWVMNQRKVQSDTKRDTSNRF